MTASDHKQIEFLNKHVGDGGFLQSDEWRNFQQSTGRRVFHFASDECFASVIEHALPVVGKYWYIPRGPVVVGGYVKNADVENFVASITKEAKKSGVAWIRTEPENGEAIDCLSEAAGKFRIRKAPHDTQPKELFIISIDGEERDILARMKSKTRYNIRLAEKKGVNVFVSREEKYIDAFCNLVEVTAERDGIVPHPRAYYRKMLEMIPEEMLRLYVAEYEGKVLAANLVVFFGNYATYLHGASGNEHREAMAPYLLQWRQILDARKKGCLFYDFGGVDTRSDRSAWAGITRFKQGFAPNQETTRFPGTYDILLDMNRYQLYRFLQSLKNLHKIFRKIS